MDQTPIPIAGTLPDAPPLPGLRFRRFCGPADYQVMADVFNAVSREDQFDSTMTAEEKATWLAARTGFDPAQDLVFAEVDGVTIAFGIVEHSQETGGTRLYYLNGRVLPAWRRRGLGRALLRHNEQRLREIAAEHPPAEPRIFQTFAMDTAPGAGALLRSEGYAPARYYYHMVRPHLDDIALTPLPAGLEVRPARPEHLRAIFDAEQEAARDHWGFTPADEDVYQAWLRAPDQDPALWRIAWDGDQVAGQVRSFIPAEENAAYQRARGYTEYISVRRPWRRRGLARALLGLSLLALKARGMTEAALRVDTENPNGALRLYEDCGFRPAGRSTEYRKPMAAA